MITSNNDLDVLIVEDNPADLELYLRFLRRDPVFNFNVRSCEDLDEARAAIQEKRPDVMLVDYNLQGHTGIDLIKELNAEPTPEEGKKTAIIMITGMGNESLAVEALKNGAHDYLLKNSLTQESIHIAIKQAIEKVSLLNKLERQRKEIEQFTYITIHDFKTPVGNIDFIVEMLEGQIDPDNSEAFESIGLLKLTNKAANQSIVDLLSVIKVNMSEDNWEGKSVDLKKVIDEEIKYLECRAVNTKASISTDLVPPTTVTFPPHVIRTAVRNLLGNAIKYSSPERSPKIKIEFDGSEGAKCLKITDNGIGIDLEKHGKNLFQMFQRFNSTTKGSGIGLYLVRRMLENNNGRIEVDSEVNKGSQFRIFLP